jgi:hypothetical protein
MYHNSTGAAADTATTQDPLLSAPARPLAFATFFQKMLLGQRCSLDDLDSLDPALYSHLVHLVNHSTAEEIERAQLRFETEVLRLVGGSRIPVSVPLVPDGHFLPVTKHNVRDYAERVADLRLNGEFAAQTRAFLRGLHMLVPGRLLRTFAPHELQALISCALASDGGSAGGVGGEGGGGGKGGKGGGQQSISTIPGREHANTSPHAGDPRLQTSSLVDPAVLSAEQLDAAVVFALDHLLPTDYTAGHARLTALRPHSHRLSLARRRQLEVTAALLPPLTAAQCQAFYDWYHSDPDDSSLAAAERWSLERRREVQLLAKRTTNNEVPAASETAIHLNEVGNPAAALVVFRQCLGFFSATDPGGLNVAKMRNNMNNCTHGTEISMS